MSSASPNRPLLDFIHDFSAADLEPRLRHEAKRLLMDLIGVAAGGSTTKMAQIMKTHAARHYGGGPVKMLCDGRSVSAMGAALAGGATIDALDAHDGHRLTKGHAGAGVLPGLLALWQAEQIREVSGHDFLTCFVVGYEVAIRVGIAQHATCCDYHTSGAWNALGVAALGARLTGQDSEMTRHALGIAEYHGPRSQMMRCIDHPTMVRDGSAWGALVGVSSAYLAQEGFTGAPALTCEAEAVADIWADLGQSWRFLEQYIKPYPVCRWAQPAITAAEALVAAHALRPEDIISVEVTTFHEAVRLQGYAPPSTVEAQYALAFPLAAFLAHGRLGAAEINDAGVKDPASLAMAQRITLVEEDHCNAAFPAQRLAKLQLETRKGSFTSDYTAASWDPEAPPSDADLVAKYQGLSQAWWSQVHSAAILDALGPLTQDGLDLNPMLEMICQDRSPEA
jgi:2-methylcitrate dehydratase PrpD